MSAVNMAPSVPRPIDVGAEMQALGRFYPDVSWTGTISEDGMGPGTPEMTAVGSGRHEPIQDGRWIVGTYEQDQFLLDRTFVLRWQLQWVVGWVPELGEYRATMVDNYGHASVMRGAIDGDRLVFTSLDDAPVRLRLTWDLQEPSAPTWRNEIGMPDGSWFLVEEYRMTPIAT